MDERLKNLTNNDPEWISQWKAADKAYFESLPSKLQREYQELAEEENNGEAPEEVQWDNQEKHLRTAFKDFSDDVWRRFGVRSTSFVTFVMRDQTVASSWYVTTHS